jgi:hypothetical protein
MNNEITRPSKAERMAFFVDYREDTVYSAHARLLQSKWREKRQLPRGRFGSFIETGFATRSRVNFLTDTIKEIVSREVESAHETGAFIAAPRIWDNLLSSQPLCFNLFGEMQADLDLATAFFRTLFPDRVEVVTALKFEYSPGRGDPKYTGDRSAFDVFVEYTNLGKRGFLGIEVKYAESLNEETVDKAAKNYRPRYGEIILESGVFKADTLEDLKRPPVAQICRDHLLSIVTKQNYDEGFFVFLYPAGNVLCARGVKAYELLLESTDEAKTGFYPRHLETFIETLCRLREAKWTKELRSRYLGD